MGSSARQEVTRLLGELREGNGAAAGRLYERVYPELRRRARGQRRRWKGDPSLQTTALAHEAYLKLVDGSEQSWEGRSHFFAVAAKAMRQILIQEARRKRAQKRGGKAPTLSLEALREAFGRAVAPAEKRAEVLLVLDEALEALEETRPRPARVVECRFYGSMTIAQTAEALGISGSTVSRDWAFARAWLCRTMQEMVDPDTPAP